MGKHNLQRKKENKTKSKDGDGDTKQIVKRKRSKDSQKIEGSKDGERGKRATKIDN